MAEKTIKLSDVELGWIKDVYAEMNKLESKYKNGLKSIVEARGLDPTNIAGAVDVDIESGELKFQYNEEDGEGTNG